MNNIAVIPARGGSKRLHHKNILLLGGIPLIAHSIIEAQKNRGIISKVYVSTDDARIGGIAEAFGAEVIMRPADLAGDFEPTVSSIKHVLENIDGSVDNVFLLQPTNPLRPRNLIADAYKLFCENDADSLMTVSRNHQKFGKIIDNKFIPFNYEIGQRSQDLEPLFFENGLLYITKASLIMDNQIIGNGHYPMVVEHVFAGVDIDNAEDFAYAEYLFLNNKE